MLKNVGKSTEGVILMKNRIRILLSAILLILTFGSMTVYADEFSLSQTKATVNIGETVELSITGTDQIPTWTSYNENIVSVNSFGKAVGLKKGKTTIRARIGSTYKTCTVTVVDSSIKLNKSAVTLYHGGTSTSTIKLKATAKGANKDVVWESSDTDVAVVDNTGTVNSVSEGKAEITATANGKSASCMVTVLESSISLDLDSLQVSTKGAGSSIKVIPAITGSKKSVKWTTSDKTIAAVSGGKVTGKKTGTATITATANGVSASCVVTVIDGNISISEEKVILYLGGTKAETKQLKTNAAKTEVVTWSSSNVDVATVNNGLITPVSAGTSIITAECNGKTDTCIVTVKDTSISIIEESVSLKTKGNKTYALNSRVIGRSSSVKWTTSDKKVVAVSKGKITAKKAGTATITATANGVSDTVTVYVSDFDPTIKLNQGSYTLYTLKGNTVTLKAAVDGANKAVTWESSDTNVASVTNKGKVTASGAGVTTITATANGVSAGCLITVKESQVNFDRTAVSLDKGEKLMLGYDVIGTKQTVTWASTNKKVATVSKGVITAKDYGEADIKATANGVTAICHVKVVNCRHEYESEITKQPTCGEAGIITYICTLCGDTYTVQTAPTGNHVHEWVTITAPTCTETGTQAYTCTVCGHTDKKQDIPALGHKWSGWVTEIPPTMTETGLQIRTCIRCGEEEYKELPMIPEDHEHEYKEEVISPDCTNRGYTIYTCECGDSYTDGYVDALGHDWSEWEEVRPATYKEAGLERRTCLRCESVEEQEIPVLADHEHKFDTKDIKPDCVNRGYTIYTCSICDYSYEADYTDALGHDWSEWTITKAATEKNGGQMERKCNRCGETETKNIPPAAHEHDYVVINSVKPTCTDYGYDQYQCNGCNDSYVSWTEPLGHDWSDWKEADGKFKRECSRCKEIEEKDIPHTVHEYKITDEKEATCTEYGYKVYECTGCNDLYVEDIEPLGHDIGDWVTVSEPSCTLYGERRKYCSRCNKTMETDYPEALGHEAGEWITIDEPTCTSYGNQEKHCIRCDRWMDFQNTDPLGHLESELVVTKEATCIEDGKGYEHCPRCGDIFNDNVTIKGSHKWNEWTVTKEPAEGVHASVADFGARQRTCDVCSEKQEETIVNIAIEDGGIKQVTGVFYDDMAYETLALVNQIRAEVGAKPLEWASGNWESYSRIRATELSYYYSHMRPGTGTANAGVSENIGMGITANSTKSIIEAWKNSSGHYANMIDPTNTLYRCTCFVTLNSNGTPSCYYWEQVFWGEVTSTSSASSSNVKAAEEISDTEDNLIEDIPDSDNQNDGESVEETYREEQSYNSETDELEELEDLAFWEPDIIAEE